MNQPSNEVGTTTGSDVQAASFDPNMPEEIWLNGEKMMSSTQALGVIYNNIVGLNIEDVNEYSTYVAWVAAHWEVKPFEPGDRFEFRSHGVLIAQNRWRLDEAVAVRVTENTIRDALGRQAAAPAAGQR